MIQNYGFSITGKSHQKRGICCQDAHEIKRLENGWIIAAVADGVGSAANAQIGAGIAARSVVEFCAACMPPDNSLISIQSMIRTAYNYAYKRICELAKISGEPVESYDTTLTMVIYDGIRVIYGHSGDGAIIGLNRYGNYVQITTPQKDQDMSSVLPLRAGYRHWVIDTYEEDLVSVLLLTDGMLETLCPYLLKQEENPEKEIYVPLAMFFADPFCWNGDNDSEVLEEFLKGESGSEEAFYERIQTGISKHIPKRKQAQAVVESVREHNLPNILMANEQDDKTVVVLFNPEGEHESREPAYYKEPDWKKLQLRWNEKAYPHLHNEPDTKEEEDEKNDT